MSASGRRKSAFQEIGLDDFDSDPRAHRSTSVSGSSGRKRPSPGVRFRSKDDVRVVERLEDEHLSGEKHESSRRPIAPRASPLPPLAYSQSPLPGTTSIMYRFGAVLLLLCAAFPFLNTPLSGRASLPLQPVSGGPIPEVVASHGSVVLDRRADSPTDVCFRWAQQCGCIGSERDYQTLTTD